MYLGLGSRYAIYRLVSSGELPAVRLAGKVRLDVRDLDALIEARKVNASAVTPQGIGRPATGRWRPLTELAPFRPERHGDGSVTGASEVRLATTRRPSRSDMQSGAPRAGRTT